MISVAIRPARPEDIEHIAPRMREADVAEVWASTRLTPETALRMALRWSEDSWTTTINGRPEVMMGVWRISHVPEAGSPWLLGTDAITKHPRRLLIEGTRVVPLILEKYKLLRNAVDDRNEASKRFLTWLGFTMSDPYPAGPDGVPFRQFEMRLSDV